MLQAVNTTTMIILCNLCMHEISCAAVCTQNHVHSHTQAFGMAVSSPISRVHWTTTFSHTKTMQAIKLANGLLMSSAHSVPGNGTRTLPRQVCCPY